MTALGEVFSGISGLLRNSREEKRIATDPGEHELPVEHDPLITTEKAQITQDLAALTRRLQQTVTISIHSQNETKSYILRPNPYQLDRRFLGTIPVISSQDKRDKAARLDHDYESLHRQIQETLDRGDFEQAKKLVGVFTQQYGLLASDFTHHVYKTQGAIYEHELQTALQTAKSSQERFAAARQAIRAYIQAFDIQLQIIPQSLIPLDPDQESINHILRILGQVGMTAEQTQLKQTFFDETGKPRRRIS